MESSANIGIIAGEASGDLLGAGLIRELHQIQSATFSGVCGPKMLEAGCKRLYDSERLAVMGLVEPLFRLPELIRMRRHLVRHFLNVRPNVFVGIDAPDFNLGLELKLKRAGIPVVHYVSPSVWAWRQKRIHKIAKATDLVLTLFPFEADFYHRHDVPAKFVGHPLADLIPLESHKDVALKQLGLDDSMEYVALLPGSRRNELKYLAETFVRAANYLCQKRPDIKFITSAINQERFDDFKAMCTRIAPNLPITFFQNRSHEVMQAASAVLVTSGTATLETMLYKKPMVIAYRMSPLTFQIARHLVKIPRVGLPNLLANELLVPEFIQDAATPQNLADALFDLLDSPQKNLQLQKKFLEIHQQLRCNASLQAAKAVAELI